MTMILSTDLTVESRCALMIEVRPSIERSAASSAARMSGL
jgi:hypothetical protein